MPSVIRQRIRAPITGKRPSLSISKSTGTLIRSLLTANFSVDLGLGARLGVIEKLRLAAREFDVAFGIPSDEIVELVGWRQPR